MNATWGKILRSERLINLLISIADYGHGRFLIKGWSVPGSGLKETVVGPGRRRKLWVLSHDASGRAACDCMPVFSWEKVIQQQDSSGNTHKVHPEGKEELGCSR